MSKIEKALKRATSERSLAVVRNTVAAPTRGSSDNRALVANPQSTALDLETRTRASAAIALMREPNRKTGAELAERRIIHPEMSESPTVRAFREIRTKILQATKGRNCVLMVTSVTGQSGGTFVALNLAAAFAFDEGKTALLLDCNLRNPRTHHILESAAAPGLTDYLENPNMDVSEIIHPVGIERLRAIPAGGRRETPAEYFTSVRMKCLLDAVRTRYPERFIILDAPPMTESADMQILAELCDYVILVVPYGGVTPLQIENCVKALDRNKLLGMVFNNEPYLPKLRSGR